MSKTKAAFPRRTVRALKTKPNHYKDEYGYKYIHKLTQFVTTVFSRRNRSIDLMPKNLRNSDLLFFLYSEPLREFSKVMFKIWDRDRISNFDWPFRNGYKPQFTQKVFEVVAISSRRPLTYTIRDEQDENIHGKLYQEELIKFS